MAETYLNLKPGAYTWEIPIDWRDTPDALALDNAAMMIVMAARDVAAGPTGVRALEEKLRAGLEGTPLWRDFDQFEGRQGDVVAGVAAAAVRLLAGRWELFGSGPHHWEELRALYDELVRTALRDDHAWARGAWVEGEDEQVTS